MEGHLNARWLARRIQTTNVSSLAFGVFPCCGCVWSPWCCGELCKPLCYSGFLLPASSCWMEICAPYGSYIPDFNLLVLKNACTLPAQIQCKSDASCSHLVPATRIFVISSLLSLKSWPASPTSHLSLVISPLFPPLSPMSSFPLLFSLCSAFPGL